MKSLICADIEALPPLPQTIAELQQICLDEETTTKQVANIIEKDPFLTADLIKNANSPLYGYTRKISSVFQAISMFGISTTKGLAIASAIKSSFQIDLSPYNITTKQFTLTANLKSAFLFQWYHNNKELLGILMPCSLVMHIGMVAISDCLKKKNQEQNFMQKFNPESFIDSENALLGCNQFEILELLFEHWNFENTMTQTVHYLLEEEFPKELESYIYPLRAVNALISPFSIASPTQINTALQCVRHYKLDVESFNTALNNIHKLQELI
ncbi:HDOD domain-containing protein [Helicobacter sp. MIT 11-5569]|uniref:HDOD domain-containing protein n=1 Tax=Helicobacter sp. MIT 11-5569 TaxID=1548151 RepID=UPI00051F93D0|nr:HDOD domain-containing protein [Helicobacter sp. MIT 11-5569]TLD81234.1 HDOD domain-containing protein [Helicobacter sp. MIT 11-5569]